MSFDLLVAEIEKFFEIHETSPEVSSFVDRFLERLDLGMARAAEPDPSSPSGWRVNAWVKKGILIAFRIGKLIKVEKTSGSQFFDKNTLPVKDISLENQIRIVPGGTAVRRGAYLANGVVIMPPSYVNVGAYVGENTMLDSHSLVGSCAQVGRDVHVSAGTQIGGVLEPVGALPVIIEDEVMIGGNCGIFEGAVVKRRAVIGAGCTITGSTPVYDLVKGKLYRRQGPQPLVIPEGAVVVPGSRSVENEFARKNKISLYTPVIIKYRDEKTDASTVLEEALR